MRTGEQQLLTQEEVSGEFSTYTNMGDGTKPIVDKGE